MSNQILEIMELFRLIKEKKISKKEKMLLLLCMKN
jgi:hypothetical protein